VSLPHVLLGLLQTEPRTGYDLARAMESELQPAWSAGVSQIYPALARLRRNGWVLLRTLGPRRGPPRLLYRVTAAGRRELARWLMLMATAPEPPARRHDPLLARVAFLDALPPAEGRRVLAGIDAALASELERWQSAHPSEGSRGVMRRAAIEEREALRRFLAREREPVIQSPGRGPRRVSTRRRAGKPARRKG
jgi:DNA-binding PadR family transcriptional regulator